MLAAALALLGVGRDAQSQEGPLEAIVGRPAILPVAVPPGAVITPGRGRLVFTVSAFRPSAAGPVVAEVTARCGARTVEVGRWGVFPDAPFAASGTVKPMRFGLTLPDAPVCDSLTAVTVGIVPTSGDGAGAVLTIRGVEFR